jgi:transcriptional regulator with XRE-family HTH domain
MEDLKLLHHPVVSYLIHRSSSSQGTDLSSIYHEIGKHVKALRIKQGMTQQDLAEKAGISVSFLSFLESGSRKGSLETYFQISTALGKDPSELFKGTQKAKSGKNKADYSPKPFPQLTASETKAVYKLVKVLRKSK